MKATVTSKGQITIPLPIRRRLRLHKGSVLEFDADSDGLRATKVEGAAQPQSAIGIARKQLAGKTVDQWLETLRGPVDAPAPRSARRSRR